MIRRALRLTSMMCCGTSRGFVASRPLSLSLQLRALATPASNSDRDKSSKRQDREKRDEDDDFWKRLEQQARDFLEKEMSRAQKPAASSKQRGNATGPRWLKSERKSSRTNNSANEDDHDDESDKNRKKSDPRVKFVGSVLLLIASFFAYSRLQERRLDGASREFVTFNEFLTTLLPTGRVKKIVVNDKDHVARAYDESGSLLGTFTVPTTAALETALLDAAHGDVRHTPDVQVNTSSPYQTLLALLPTLLLFGATIYSMRQFGSQARSLFATGATNFRISPENVTVRFSDVAGLDEAKREVTEFVEFLRRPAKFRRLGARIPRGALLVGPPGTGKTLLAKATAGEAQVPFFSLAGSDFTEMFVGVGPARVRDLFKQARASAPCIVFLDEIDAVGRARSSQRFSNDERESTLNQLLVELDGFDVHSGIVVLAGTNRPDVLDKALLRPGRFDRTVTIDLPDIRGRKQIFEIHLKRITLQLDRSALAESLAALTPGFSGADISNVCNEAALIAARGRAAFVEMKHFEQAIERVVAGLAKQNRVLSESERRIVAVHESGHAIVGYFLQHCDPLLKVSIVPRGAGALGYAMYQPLERAVTTIEEMADRMAMTLAGRAAEDIVFGRISTGAADDLDKVTKLAYYQVTSGLNDRVGPLAFAAPDPSDIFATRQYGEATAKLVDIEVRALVVSAYNRARELLASKRELVDKLSARLYDAEQLVYADLKEILGPRPWPERRLYSEIVADDARRQRNAPAAN